MASRRSQSRFRYSRYFSFNIMPTFIVFIIVGLTIIFVIFILIFTLISSKKSACFTAFLLFSPPLYYSAPYLSFQCHFTSPHSLEPLPPSSSPLSPLLSSPIYFTFSLFSPRFTSPLLVPPVPSLLLTSPPLTLIRSFLRAGKSEYIGADLLFPLLVGVLVHAKIPNIHLILGSDLYG